MFTVVLFVHKHTHINYNNVTLHYCLTHFIRKSKDTSRSEYGVANPPYVSFTGLSLGPYEKLFVCRKTNTRKSYLRKIFYKRRDFQPDSPLQLDLSFVWTEAGISLCFTLRQYIQFDCNQTTLCFEFCSLDIILCDNSYHRPFRVTAGCARGFSSLPWVAVRPF